jgi:ribulose-5-phosphate 4-epimerase/fuculose-1-phosphate aldolase
MRTLTALLAVASALNVVAVAQNAPASGPPSPALIEDLVAANRILVQKGVVDEFGHVSVRHDRDPNRYLLSRSLAPALVSASDIVEYNLDSQPVNANAPAGYLERFIHGEIYKARPDVRAIVHGHAASLIPFGVTGVPLRPVFHMGGFIGGNGLPIFEIRTSGGVTNMLVSTPALGRALAQSLGSRPAALMRGHGAVVVGPSLMFAVARSVYLENNARIQLQAMNMGARVNYLTAGESDKIMESGEMPYGRPWEIWKREALGK